MTISASQPTDARVVANVFLTSARRDGERLDLARTMHLVYFAHGWHLGLAGEPLLDEEVQARDGGPIVGSLYEEGRRIGSNPIPEGFWFPGEDGSVVVTFAAADDGRGALVERIWSTYGRLADLRLAQIVAGSGTPWRMTWLANVAGLRQLAIRNADIERYFVAQRHRAEVTTNARGLDAIRGENPETM